MEQLPGSGTKPEEAALVVLIAALQRQAASCGPVPARFRHLVDQWHFPCSFRASPSDLPEPGYERKGADYFMDALLLGPGQTAVEAATWGRIKATVPSPEGSP